jgi:hypothetical protein
MPGIGRAKTPTDIVMSPLKREHPAKLLCTWRVLPLPLAMDPLTIVEGLAMIDRSSEGHHADPSAQGRTGTGGFSLAACFDPRGQF